MNSYNYTIDEINEFMCGSELSGHAFVTSPYQETIIDSRTGEHKQIQINEQNYNMSCEVFYVTNSTGDRNIMQHFFLDTSGVIKPSFIKNFRNE